MFIPYDRYMVNNNNNNIWQTACVTAGCQSRAGTCWACLNCQVNLGLSSSVSLFIRAEDPVDLSADPDDLFADPVDLSADPVDLSIDPV